MYIWFNQLFFEMKLFYCAICTWKMKIIYINASDFNHFTKNSVVLLSCSIYSAELNVFCANNRYWIRHSMLISYTSSWILLRLVFISISNFEFCLNWLKHFSSNVTWAHRLHWAHSGESICSQKPLRMLVHIVDIINILKLRCFVQFTCAFRA